ncbi:MAG: hypothetical protein IH984_15045 [Planctomycetes bacterium]|nr:hypothetical protein [Planctomycetota bacterium]
MADQSLKAATLFDESPAVRSSSTSCEAARQMKSKAPHLKRRILKFLIEQREAGTTDEEIQLALSITGNSERPRRVSLVNLGLKHSSRHTRSTQSGARATVWVASSAGQLEIEGDNHNAE